jgi:DNA repair protein RadC
MKTNNQKIIRLKDFEHSPGVAEVKVSYISHPSEKAKVNSSEDAFLLLYPLFNKYTISYQEEFYLLLLNRANRSLGWIRLSAGGTTGTVVDLKILFSIALLTNAHAIILCHNHPSSQLRPSQADISLTKKVKEAGILLDIILFDHLIVTPEGSYFSFSNEGML